MGGKWPHSCSFVRCWFQDLFWIACSILVYFLSCFFSMRFVSIYVVHPYSNIDTATAWKKSHFISSDRSNFHIINNQSIEVHTFAGRILTLLSVDEILLHRYVNLSTNFRVEMAPSRLKHMYSVLFAFIPKPMFLTVIVSTGYHHLLAFFWCKAICFIRFINI